MNVQLSKQGNLRRFFSIQLIASFAIASLMISGCSSETSEPVPGTGTNTPVQPAEIPSEKPEDMEPLPAISSELKNATKGELDPENKNTPETNPKPAETEVAPIQAASKEIKKWEFEKPVTANAISDDGKLLALSTGDKITIVDLTNESLEPVQTIDGLSGDATALVFKPSTHMLYAAVGAFSKPGTILAWDLDNNAEEVKSFTGHLGMISAIVFSPDAKTLYSSGVGGAIYVWDDATAKSTDKITVKGRATQNLSISKDGKYLAESNIANIVQVIDLDAKKVIRTLDHPNHVLSVQIAPDQSYLATGCFDRFVRLIDSQTGNVTDQLTGHEGPVTSLIFLADGTQLISSGGDGKIIFWDTKTKQKIKELESHKGYVTSIGLSPDQTKLISTGEDKSAILYQLK